MKFKLLQIELCCYKCIQKHKKLSWSKLFFILWIYLNSSVQVNKIGKQILGNEFVGVFPLDKIPYLSNNQAIIVNTHSSHLGGEHWIAIYVKPGNIFVFDPMGFYYPALLISKLQTMGKPIVYNKTMFQNPLTQTCGQHCLAWLLYKKFDV